MTGNTIDLTKFGFLKSNEPIDAFLIKSVGYKTVEGLDMSVLSLRLMDGTALYSCEQKSFEARSNANALENLRMKICGT